MRWRLGAVIVGVGLAGGGQASAAPHPLDQPDLDAASMVAARVEGVTAPRTRYEHDAWSLITTLAASYRVAALDAAVTVSAPLICPVTPDRGLDLGNLTVGALATRPLAPGVRAGLGAAWTVPFTTYARTGELAHVLVLDGYRYFDRGHVGQLHADLRWRRDAVAVQSQLGIEHYVMADWRDQTLARAAVAATVWLDTLGFTVEGTMLTDVLDEEHDEGADVVGAVSLAVQGAWRGAAIGGHVTRSATVDDMFLPTSAWSLGLDLAYPVAW